MEMGSANARVLIPHLPFPSSSSHDPSTNPNPKPSKPLSFSDHYRLPTRRLLLFSLPLLTPSDSTEILPCEFFCEREASAAIFPGVSEPVELLDRGRELQPLGDFNQTLLCFTVVRTNSVHLCCVIEFFFSILTFVQICLCSDSVATTLIEVFGFVN